MAYSRFSRLSRLSRRRGKKSFGNRSNRFRRFSSKRFSSKRSKLSKFGSSGTTASNYLRVYQNPFSQATSTPKIPDGSCNQSYGIRLQNIQNVVNADDTDMIIYIFPGLTSGCYIIGDTRSDLDYPGYRVGPPFPLPAGADDLTEGASYDLLNNDAIGPTDRPNVLFQSMRVGRERDSLYSRHIQIPLEWWNQPTEKHIDATFKNPLAKKWRIVSQGTRISLTNNYDSNEGWFEAFRTVATADDFQTIPVRRVNPATVADRAAAVAVNLNYDNWPYVNIGLIPNRHLSLINLEQHPSYVVGKLTDINKYLFQLKPVNTEHVFREFTFGGKMLLLDSNFDVIVIKVHGKANNQNTPGSGLVVHTICNMELIYDEDKFGSRLMSRCVKDKPGLSRASTTLTSDMKACRKILSV
jgi:hypothetical protein